MSFFLLSVRKYPNYNAIHARIRRISRLVAELSSLFEFIDILPRSCSRIPREFWDRRKIVYIYISLFPFLECFKTLYHVPYGTHISQWRVYTLQNAAVERGIVVNWNASAWLTSPGQSPPREALLKKKKSKKRGNKRQKCGANAHWSTGQFYFTKKNLSHWRYFYYLLAK